MWLCLKIGDLQKSELVYHFYGNPSADGYLVVTTPFSSTFRHTHVNAKMCRIQDDDQLVHDQQVERSMNPPVKKYITKCNQDAFPTRK